MNGTISTDPDPTSARWLGIIYAVYALIGIPANILVLFLTVAKEKVRSVPLNVCIFSLAFADMMVLVSATSSTFYAINFNDNVCKVGGVGIYVFIITSMTLPSGLAMCRHANVSSVQDLSPVLRGLRTRKGIIILNGIYWTYGALFTLPLIYNDRFGLDPMGLCGVTKIDSVLLWAYFMVFVMGPLFVGYTITFVFYGKLGAWVKKTSSLLTMSLITRETLVATHNLMRMVKWLLIIPVFFYYPSPMCEYMLRFFPGIVSVRTARIILIVMPLPHVLDPFATIYFIKRYRIALMELLCIKNSSSSSLILPNVTTVS